jgi:ribonuclease P protein component
VVQAMIRNDGRQAVRFGFTTTKKIGGAVVRNRARRRLREAARALSGRLAVPGTDYVLIGRRGTADCPWPRLLDDLESALLSLRTRSSRSRPAAPAALRDGPSAED